MRIYPKDGTNKAPEEHQSKCNIDRYGSISDQNPAYTGFFIIGAVYKCFTILLILDHYCEVEIVSAISTYVEDWGQPRTKI